jgi:hypothetical protein
MVRTDISELNTGELYAAPAPDVAPEQDAVPGPGAAPRVRAVPAGRVPGGPGPQVQEPVEEALVEPGPAEQELVPLGPELQAQERVVPAALFRSAAAVDPVGPVVPDAPADSIPAPVKGNCSRLAPEARPEAPTRGPAGSPVSGRRVGPLQGSLSQPSERLPATPEQNVDPPPARCWLEPTFLAA